ncbi:glycosyltransferase family 2 protein [Halorubrum ezzemoulense]|uniref:Glycosyltransferase family 2 protein n=1 Tax=Halorubrum ezzemoulense TaxID=337243 RepID=A0ABT4Z7A1_HALEZ|nr:glycosyltransferase family 2 protein [Halorubrum ezzemoulense]MDB2294062.1 glycosyltransferase family 2 protein [Halorubrum ezzemoulense]
MNPLVSVIITTYDRPKMCKRAVESALCQTYENLEIILVEDGTETDIKEWVVTKYPEVQYIRHETNKGLAAARNTGLEKSTGEYIAYLDDDDAWKATRIEKQISRLEQLSSNERNNVGVVYCGTEHRTPGGDVISTSYPENSGNLRESIQEIGASTISSSFLFNRECLINVGGFDESLSSSIDHDIWMSLAVRDYHALTVDEPLVIAFQSEDENMMSNTQTRITGVEQYVKKWIPTYQDWYGVEEGNVYGERYFARVIARLVGEKTANGDFSEAWFAIQSIYRFSKQYPYNTRVITSQIVRSVVTQKFPEPVVDILRSLKNQV